MDVAGRNGGPCRPPRAAAARRTRRGGSSARRPRPRWPRATAVAGGRRCDRSASSTPSTHTPRACRPGSSPAASASSRARRWPSAASTSSSNCDELRTLLMYEPRGHAAMSGAILQPPTRPDADYGVLFIEVSGCLPMCGHGTIGVATVLVETGMVAVTEPVTTDPARHAGRAGRRRGARSRTAPRRAVTIRNVPSFSRRPGPARDGPRLRRGPLRHGVRRQLLRDRRAWTSSACRSTARSKNDILDAGLAIMDGDQRAERAGAPRATRTSTAAITSYLAPGSDRPALPPRDGHPPRLVRPLAVRHRHLRPGWPSCTPAASWPWATTSSTSRSSAPASSGGSSRTTEVGGRARRRPDDHRPGLDHRHRPVPPRPRPTRSPQGFLL